MKYLSLSLPLHATADAAMRYFRDKLGATRFRAEVPVEESIQYCPTLVATTRDYHLLCVEVTDVGYSDALDSFVADCVQNFVPVKLYIALPIQTSPTVEQAVLTRARRRGVGVLKVGAHDAELIQRALPLSLAGVRAVDMKGFPLKYRQALSDAADCFKGGDPAKGCGAVYEEIEALSRRMAEKTHQKGMWTGTGRKPRFKTMNWAPLMEQFIRELDITRCRKTCKHLSAVLLGRVLGVTGHRNESAHKPKTRAERMKRDSELRTRFEGGVDLLRDMVVAARPLRV